MTYCQEKVQLDLVAHICNPNVEEAEREKLPCVLGLLRLQQERK